MSVGTSNVSEIALDIAAGEFPINKVTVYNDRAEIRRKFVFRPTNSGETLVKLSGLPDTMDTQSIRADIPSKNAKLLEVYDETKWEYPKAEQGDLDQLNALTIEMDKLRSKVNRNSEKKAKVAAHQNAVLAALKPDGGASGQAAVDPELFKKVKVALEFYDSLNEKIKAVEEGFEAEISNLQQEQLKLITKTQNASIPKRISEVSIHMDIPQAAVEKSKKPVVVELCYIVNGARWEASYDIRAEKDAKKVALTYYGEVTNSTKENWVEVELSLSTAQPSIGGALPPLPRKQVDFTTSAPVFFAKKEAAPLMRNMSMRRSVARAAAPMALMSAPIAPPPAVATANVKTADAGSTIFRIHRLANLDSDYKPHKQTISILQLDAVFTHAASPKMSKFVFLKCSTKNTSVYPLLAGKMGVFIDGSFINNSAMELVLPSEDFSLFLGIDDNVKLNYGPEVVKKKMVGASGMMRSGKRYLKTISRDITVSNISPTPINCTIYEQLPLAKDDKIKVELKKPDMKKAPNGRHLINAFNHLETHTIIEPSKNFNMIFEYSMEWPEGDEINILTKS